MMGHGRNTNRQTETQCKQGSIQLVNVAMYRETPDRVDIEFRGNKGFLHNKIHNTFLLKLVGAVVRDCAFHVHFA